MTKIVSDKVSYEGSIGALISGRVDRPESGVTKGYAVFSHCFTCSKDFHASKRVAEALAQRGYGVLRFDFTGLAGSEGLFEDTNFTTNTQDILKGVEFLKENYEAPVMMIGHSLGGAATLFAAPEVDSVKAVVTLNAPCDPAHVRHRFEDKVKEICEKGEASIIVGGRPFKLQKHFLDALSEKRTDEKLAKLNAALLVCHTPIDTTVSIEQAAHIFMAAKHPKSFISLDDADHLLVDKADTSYVAEVIDAWASRYITP